MNQCHVTADTVPVQYSKIPLFDNPFSLFVTEQNTVVLELPFCNHLEGENRVLTKPASAQHEMCARLQTQELCTKNAHQASMRKTIWKLSDMV